VEKEHRGKDTKRKKERNRMRGEDVIYILRTACFRRPENRPQRSFGQIVVFTITICQQYRKGNATTAAGETLLFYILLFLYCSETFPLFLPAPLLYIPKFDNNKSYSGVV
jgi:hypothetical protein